MSVSHDQVYEFALSLPQPERADLAFQLLQSLEPPRDEMAPEEFKEKLHNRVQAYRRGEVKSYSLNETRDIIEQKLSEGRGS